MNAVALLARPVLTLNSHWVPIQTTSVKEAIGLVAKGSAVIIDVDNYEVHDLETWNDASAAKKVLEGAVIRSARLTLVPPDVIRLTKYEKMGARSVIFSRRNIFKRDRYTCQFCGGQPGSKELTIDHVMPRSRGGLGSWENCVLACVSCNKRKSNRTPAEAKMPLRKTPVKPTWKMLAQVSPTARRQSWAKFLSKAYWETELAP